jgi:hypothetical protein
VATDIPRRNRIRVAIIVLRKCPMTSPYCWTPAWSHTVSPKNVIGITPAAARAILA